MISLATTILWGTLAIFIITAAYSASLIEIQFGDPEIFLSDNNVLVIMLSMKINNKGYYHIREFLLKTEVKDENGIKISNQQTYVDIIPARMQTWVKHNITFILNDLTGIISLLFKDANLTLTSEVELKFTELLPVELYTNTSYLWGAPFHNFTLGEPAFEQYNYTYSILSLPLNFENHSFFNITGTVYLKVFNEQDDIVSAAKFPIEVYSGSKYSDRLKIYVKNTEIPIGGRVELFFESETFSFGPLVIYLG
jgi:hypothetical protein